MQGVSPDVIAEAEGGDEAETLLNLWATLIERQASPDVSVFVAGGVRTAHRQAARRHR